MDCHQFVVMACKSVIRIDRVLHLFIQMSLSTHECNRTFAPPLLTFRCPSSVSNQLLRLNDLTVDQLDSVTSISAGGWNSSTIGPFTSLPGNLCFLKKLQVRSMIVSMNGGK